MNFVMRLRSERIPADKGNSSHASVILKCDPYFKKKKKDKYIFSMSIPLDCIVLGLESRRRYYHERIYLTME